MNIDSSRIAAVAAKFPLPEGRTFSYGTAGFRTQGDVLEGLAFRVSLLMCLRSVQKKAATGIVVSASHNPSVDNGVKLVDTTGAMLDQSWEPLAERLANAKTAEEIVEVLRAVETKENIDPASSVPVVMIGSDTRKTGPALVAAVEAGIAAVGGKAVNHGIATTPQLHYYVCKQAEKPDESHYYASTQSAFETLLDATPIGQEVTVDCSNGVGYPKMVEVARRLAKVAQFKLLNGAVEKHSALNAQCGADFIQKEKVAPKGLDPAAYKKNDHVAAFDGDADRLVYFFFDDGKFNLLDGDRIAVLYASYVKHLMNQIAGFDARIGIVQTAYANGASTIYMRETLKVDVAFTPTGVKHLHHKALDYDIGIYFEANGHGTVVMADAVRETLAALTDNKAAQELLAVSNLASPVCGDAIADLLLCEAALARLAWSIQDWANLYTDAPSRMTKVQVPDPQRLTTVWDQTRATAPSGLQESIDTTVATYAKTSRAFVRPSGTEPIVRVYAEADTQENADRLAGEVGESVKAHLK